MLLRSSRSAYEAALARDLVTFGKKELGDMADADIPSRDEFIASGGKAEEYEEFIAKKQAELQKQADAHVAKLAKSSAKVKTAGKFKLAQASYLLPCKAPFVKDKSGSLVANGKPEPGIRIPIAKVVRIPLRDEAHLEWLRQDPNLEICEDDVPTEEELEAARAAAVEAAKRKAQDAAKASKK